MSDMLLAYRLLFNEDFFGRVRQAKVYRTLRLF